MYENQKGYWRDLELVESIWKMKPDIESPEIFSEPPTPAMVHDTIACTPENKSDDVLSSRSLATRASVFHQRNEESISIMKTKSNLFLR